MPRISPFLWLDGQARAAAWFYVSIFPNSKLPGIHRYSEAGQEQNDQTPGSVMTVEFELDGQRCTALSGRPHFQFTPAVYFVVNCKTKAEVNLYGHRLSEGGALEVRQCGWLAPGSGVSWQIVPERMPDRHSDPATAEPAMLAMKKIDIAGIARACDG